MPAAAEIQKEQTTAPQRPGGLSPQTAPEPSGTAERTISPTSTAPTAASARLEELAADLFDESKEERDITGDEELDSLIDDLL